MPPVRAIASSLRVFATILMVVLVMAFSAADNRAMVLSRVAEESGIGRFYEDKIHCVQANAVRLACEHRRHSAAAPLDRQVSRVPEAIRLDEGDRLAVGPRAPPHQPRAPPRLG